MQMMKYLLRRILLRRTTDTKEDISLEMEIFEVESEVECSQNLKHFGEEEFQRERSSVMVVRNWFNLPLYQELALQKSEDKLGRMRLLLVVLI